MTTIGKLAREFGLSRSTLLYYDSIGLLCPSIRSESGYRVYRSAEIERLQRICQFREAGLSLSDIKHLINKSDAATYTATLEKRLTDLNEEIGALRKQQQVIIHILRNKGKRGSNKVMTKDQWVNLLRTCGMDKTARDRWHVEFEKLSGPSHHDFLRSLGLDEKEIKRIRKNSRPAK